MVKVEAKSQRKASEGVAPVTGEDEAVLNIRSEEVREDAELSPDPAEAALDAIRAVVGVENEWVNFGDADFVTYGGTQARLEGGLLRLVDLGEINDGARPEMLLQEGYVSVTDMLRDDGSFRDDAVAILRTSGINAFKAGKVDSVKFSDLDGEDRKIAASSWLQGITGYSGEWKSSTTHFGPKGDGLTADDFARQHPLNGAERLLDVRGCFHGNTPKPKELSDLGLYSYDQWFHDGLEEHLSEMGLANVSRPSSDNAATWAKQSSYERHLAPMVEVVQQTLRELRGPVSCRWASPDGRSRDVQFAQALIRLAKMAESEGVVFSEKGDADRALESIRTECPWLGLPSRSLDPDELANWCAQILQYTEDCAALPLQYGCVAPMDSVAAWTARAIQEKGGLSLLPDRQDRFTESENVSEMLRKWLDESALPELRAEVGKIRQGRDGHHRIDAGLFHLDGRTRGGYVYISAWVDRTVPSFQAKYSGLEGVPALGECVKVEMNGIGPGVVVGFKEAEGYLGIEVLATRPPLWLKSQLAEIGKPHCLVFGRDIRRPDR